MTEKTTDRDDTPPARRPGTTRDAAAATAKTARATAADFHPEVLRPFDGYVHGRIDRRGFLEGAAKFAVGGVTAAALLDRAQRHADAGRDPRPSATASAGRGGGP